MAQTGMTANKKIEDTLGSGMKRLESGQERCGIQVNRDRPIRKIEWVRTIELDSHKVRHTGSVRVCFEL